MLSQEEKAALDDAMRALEVVLEVVSPFEHQQLRTSIYACLGMLIQAVRYANAQADLPRPGDQPL